MGRGGRKYRKGQVRDIMTEKSSPQSTRIAEVKPADTITPPEPQLSQLMTEADEEWVKEQLRRGSCMECFHGKNGPCSARSPRTLCNWWKPLQKNNRISNTVSRSRQSPEPQYKTIRRDGITVAEGWQCPKCGVITARKYHCTEPQLAQLMTDQAERDNTVSSPELNR